MDVKAQNRFWKKVAKGAPDECWSWLAGTTTGGYGSFRVDRVTVTTAHRVAYALEHGEVPEGLEVAQTCRNPVCCNPDHLCLATHQENMRDAHTQQRKGDIRRFTRDEVVGLRSRVSAGVSAEELAAELGCSPAAVRRYIRPQRQRGRAKKSSPFAVRLPVELAEWVEHYAREGGLTKTAVMESAVRKLKLSEARRLNVKRQTLMDTIKRADG